MGTYNVISGLRRGCHSNANLVRVMISVVIPRSSAMAPEDVKVRERQRVEGWWVLLVWGSCR